MKLYFKVLKQNFNNGKTALDFHAENEFLDIRFDGFGYIIPAEISNIVFQSGNIPAMTLHNIKIDHYKAVPHRLLTNKMQLKVWFNDKDKQEYHTIRIDMQTVLNHLVERDNYLSTELSDDQKDVYCFEAVRDDWGFIPIEELFLNKHSVSPDDVLWMLSMYLAKNISENVLEDIKPVEKEAVKALIENKEIAA